MPGFGPVGSAPIGGSTADASQSSINATAAGAILVAAAAIAAGAATGTAAGTAPGAALTGTSSIAAGSASGTAAGTAPGASLHGTSSIAAGAASGTVSASATAPGAAMVGTGSIRAGTASGAIGAQQNTLTVPPSRIAVFAGRQRVVVFSGKAPVSVAKGALDELWYVGDFSKDVGDSATSAASVTYVSAGVAVLVAPTLQGNLGLVKLGALDPAGGTFTFRVTCDNGEQFDRTIVLTVLDDRTHIFGKDPDDKRLYTFDFGADAALGTTSLASAQAPVATGVSALSTVTIQGNRAVVMVGGLDPAGENSCQLAALFANGEKVVRSIYFIEEDH